MDITGIYNAIIEKLNKSGFEKVSKDLRLLLAGAATGGEGLESTGAYLVDLKKNNREAFECIKTNIEDYLYFCKKNGIIIN